MVCFALLELLTPRLLLRAGRPLRNTLCVLTAAAALAGLIVISIGLDLIPIGAVLLFLAFAPLSRAMRGRSVGIRRAPLSS